MHLDALAQSFAAAPVSFHSSTQYYSFWEVWLAKPKNVKAIRKMVDRKNFKVSFNKGVHVLTTWAHIVETLQMSKEIPRFVEMVKSQISKIVSSKESSARLAKKYKEIGYIISGTKYT